jgi:hypothetical protein
MKNQEVKDVPVKDQAILDRELKKSEIPPNSDRPDVDGIIENLKKVTGIEYANSTNIDVLGFSFPNNKKFSVKEPLVSARSGNIFSVWDHNNVNYEISLDTGLVITQTFKS